MNQRQLGVLDTGSLQNGYVIEPRVEYPPFDGKHTIRSLDVAGSGVMIERSRVFRDEDHHPFTLSQVTDKVRTEGTWPSLITLRRGWARAYARPWNDDPQHGFIRLDRGGRDFLADATAKLRDFGVAAVFSPALYPNSTRVWMNAGFEEASRLGVMERSLTRPVGEHSGVCEEKNVNWFELESIDNMAFEGFWRLTAQGLAETLDATTRVAVLTRRESDRLVGYTIVGAQQGVSYLQRICVHPEFRGRGLGAELVRAGVAWARHTYSSVMVLNVRDENTAARSLYSKEGFLPTGTHLRILRHPL